MYVEVKNQNYQPGKSVEKGAKGAVATTIGGAMTTLVVIALQAIQAGGLDDAMTTALTGAILTLVTAGISGAAEWWRNRSKHSAIRIWKPGGCILVLLALGVGASGCATWAPAVSGKTHYDVEFSDVTADQATNYRMAIKAPAGADLASLTGMTYDWNPDGSGGIAVSQDQTTDTRGQATLIADVNAQSMAAVASSLSKIMDVIAPFLSQYLDARVREGELQQGVALEALQWLPEKVPRN